MSESEVKKCPKCGGELEQGFIRAARGIRWDTEEHKGSYVKKHYCLNGA